MSVPERAKAGGGCQCGAARYELHGAPLRVWICHCTECRKQSASAFGISVTVRREQLRPLRGEVAKWSRDCDSGRRLDCFFCPICGSRLWHEQAGATTLNVKGGSLDDPIDVASATHIWTARKLEGVVIPENAERFAYEPS
ncbi:MAG: GFA family protein [Pseudomonadota bacterium]